MLNDDQLVKEAGLTLKLKGAYIPVTDEEVTKFEASMEGTWLPLPSHMKPPIDLLGKKELKIRKGEGAVSNDEYAEHIALAARNGKSIDPETQKKMASDREKAEKNNGHFTSSQEGNS